MAPAPLAAAAQLQPPPLCVDAVTVRDHPEFGRSAFAVRDIKAGEMVICEDPLLRLDDGQSAKGVAGLLRAIEKFLSSSPARHELLDGRLAAEASRIHESDWASACGFYLAFCRAAPDVRAAVLNDMFSDPGASLEDTAPVARSRVQATVLAAIAPDVERLLSILSAVGGAAAAAGEAGTASKATTPAAAAAAVRDAATLQKLLLAVELNVHAQEAR